MTLALPRHKPPAASSTATAGVAVACAILVVGTAWRLASPANSDIAWLLTVGEHVLDGAVPYRDIIETNPPGSVMLYMPAVLIGRALGVDAQAVALVLTGLACAASLAACAALLRRIILPALRGPLLAIAAAVLVLLPTGSFGQREHVILLCLLPLLCRLALRVGGTAPPARASVLAGIAAGIGLAIKPHYGLGLVGPALLVWRATGWRGLVRAPELWTAGAIAATLLGAQLLLFPAFTHDVLPLLSRVYLPMRLPLLDLLRLPGCAAAIAILIGCALARRAATTALDQAVSETAGTAALGFFAAYLLQAKGWPYHAYPCTAAALIALGASLAGPMAGATISRLRAGRIAAVALAGWAALGFDLHMDIDVEAPGLAPALMALAPHPRVMSLASDLAVGHPLVRRIGGRWVGTLMSSWIDLYADRIAPGAGRHGILGPDLAFEARTLASDIRDRHPDAVLTSTDGWAEWIAGEPEVAAALEAYRPTGTYGSVTLWTPRAGTPSPLRGSLKAARA